MPSEAKVRLDLLLVGLGHFETREAAKRAIMAGLVTSQGEIMDKPGSMVRPSLSVQVAEPPHAFVSRGGVKLSHALDTFGVNPAQQVVIDVGASTGGFTDCVLQRGATLVHAVDVGYGQFAWKLRNDARVKLYERTNFRHVEPDLFRPIPSLAVMDVSFISIGLLLPKLWDVLEESGQVVSLVKPQFEAGRSNVGKGGIVRDADIHVAVLQKAVGSARAAGFVPVQVTYSPVEGGDGNIEFFIHAKKPGESVQEPLTDAALCDVVIRAWNELKQLEPVLRVDDGGKEMG